MRWKNVKKKLKDCKMIIENVEVIYCKIDEPNENDKFKLIFGIEDEDERQDLIDMIDADWEENKGSLKGKFKKPTNMAYFEAESNEEYPDDKWTGKTIFTASSVAVTKDGKEREVKVYDADARLVDDKVKASIGKGSIINLSTSAYTWEFKKLAGTKLNLNSIQLVKLVEFTGGDTFAALEGNDFTEKKDKKKKKKKKK